jgi:acetolactate synthase-1/2/3 large subunit
VTRAGNVADVTEANQDSAGAGAARATRDGGGETPRHGGARAVAAARAHGVSTMFTLSGGHVFPLYDGAVKADPPMRLVDVRHEQTAVFAAEATARLTRLPGLAVLTAGPGVTNGISGITTAHFNGSAVVVLAGRAPDYRWGSAACRRSTTRCCSPGHQARLDRAPGRPGERRRW